MIKNEHQEALNELRRLSVSERQNKLYDSLQELVDKETPMKPVYRIPDISWNKNEKLAHCPTCDWRLDWEQGCHNNKCRQKIDWSNENE